MARAFRYLCRTYLTNLLLSGGLISLIALLATHVFRLEVLQVYYTMLPLFFVLFTLIYSFTLATIYRQLALSFGCRRRDYFWGCQIAFLVGALGYVLLSAVAGWLPSLLPGGYATVELADELFTSGAPVWSAPLPMAALGLTYLFLQPIGTAAASLFGKSKVFSVIFFVVILMGSAACSAISLFVMDGTIVLPPALIWGVLGGGAALSLGCQVLFYRLNAKAVVTL